MSEKQRFEITDYGSEYYVEIIDNKKELDKSIDNPTQRLDLVECCGLLNEFELKCYKLEKENEQLRKELDNFKPVMFQDVRKGTVILYSKGDIDE